jgi:hypothetical protein
MSSSSSSHHFYPSLYLSFNYVFYNSVLMQDVTNPDSLPSFTVCRTFLSSLTTCNASSFLTHSSSTPIAFLSLISLTAVHTRVKFKCGKMEAGSGLMPLVTHRRADKAMGCRKIARDNREQVPPLDQVQPSNLNTVL